MNQALSSKIDKFFSQFPLRKYDKDRIMVHAGDNPPGVFYLVSGQVRQYDITEQGNEVIVNVFKPPAFFPMNWAINQTANKYFFAADAAVSFRLAPADETVRFLKSNPDVAFNLLQRLYSGTDGVLRRMAHLMGGSAKTRLIYEIIIEARRFGKHQSDNSLLITLHEEELAARAGLSRETVSRELAKIRDLGLLDVSRHGIRLKSIDKLEAELGDNL